MRPGKVTQALPGLPDTIRDKEVKSHLLSTLSDKLSLHLKLLPEEGYTSTIAKATELLLIYKHAEMRESHTHINQPVTSTSDNRLNKLEEAVLQVTQQPTALSSMDL